MSRILVALLVVLLAQPAWSQAFSSLEERMSTAEFKAAGLDKLSSEELATLNAWLQREGLRAAAAAPSAEDRRGLTGARETRGEIHSRVVGEFRGWSGNSRFELENGQVWQVNDPTANLSARAENPSVRIKPGLFSAWFMQVEGYNSVVKVKRIK